MSLSPGGKFGGGIKKYMVIIVFALEEAITAVDRVSGKKRTCQKSSLK